MKNGSRPELEETSSIHYLIEHRIHIRRGGRQFKSASRYLKVTNMVDFFFEYEIEHRMHIRRGGRQFKSASRYLKVTNMVAFFNS